MFQNILWLYHSRYFQQKTATFILTFMCVIPIVCVTNKEGGVVKQHN